MQRLHDNGDMQCAHATDTLIAISLQREDERSSRAAHL